MLCAARYRPALRRRASIVLAGLLLGTVHSMPAADVSAIRSSAVAFVQAGGDQGARCAALLRELDRAPYPESGPWHFISQAFGAYWTNDCATGDKAIMGLEQEMTTEAETPSVHSPPAELEGGLPLAGLPNCADS
jgi:hypothetical protein